MKGILGLLRNKLPPEDQREVEEYVFFTTAFADHGISADQTIPWEARAVEVGAKRLSMDKGAPKLQELWRRDPHMKRLDGPSMDALMHFFDFATIAAGRELMHQDEYGSFMIVLLSGSIAVDRDQQWGERVRLSEARPGEILGEMSLLDSGKRFSHCLTLTDSEIDHSGCGGDGRDDDGAAGSGRQPDRLARAQDALAVASSWVAHRSWPRAKPKPASNQRVSTWPAIQAS